MSLSGRWSHRVRAPLILVLGLMLVLILGAQGISEVRPWWSGAVFYEVFVRSFYDSNGDGKGDLQGLIEKLDYLKDLGVRGLWLMPICESPSYHGYDVTDYYTVERDYGTNEDFRDLVREAHARGIRVIVDLVLNHTSRLNPWFLASWDPTSPFRDWYIWKTARPAYAGPWGEPVWYARGAANYYAIFGASMPDLNYRDPDVTVRMLDVARYWVTEMGADGLRLDAARYLIEDGPAQEDTPATHFWFRLFSDVVKAYKPDALLVGEVWADPSVIVPYLDGQMDLCFEFSLADAIVSAVSTGYGGRLTETLERILSLYPDGRFATFLSNHDQERVMSDLQGDTAKAELAAAILLTLPGAPFVYYGEEIGMTGNKPDERIRTPMQWDATSEGGFTSGVPWEPLQPDAAARTVAAEAGDPSSLLSEYRRLIHLRTDHAALREGATVLLDSTNPALVPYLRSDASEALVVIHNLSDEEQTVSSLRGLSHADAGLRAARDLLSGAALTFRVQADGSAEGIGLKLNPHGTAILQLSTP